MKPLLSSVLHEAAERVLDYDGPAAPLNLDALVDTLEHAAVLAAEHEYSAAHGSVRSDFHRDGATVYPPLIKLLAQVATLPVPLVVRALEPADAEEPWLAANVCAMAVCPCGFRTWLTAGPAGEDPDVEERRVHDEQVAAHFNACTFEVSA